MAVVPQRPVWWAGHDAVYGLRLQVSCETPCVAEQHGDLRWVHAPHLSASSSVLRQKSPPSQLTLPHRLATHGYARAGSHECGANPQGIMSLTSQKQSSP